MAKTNIKQLEGKLWEAADELRQGSKLTSNQYCMPVLALLFLRYAYGRFRTVEKQILVNRPVRNGRMMPVESSDFKEKSAIFLPEEAQFDFLVNLPEDVKMKDLHNVDGQPINSLGEAVNNAMRLVEQQSETLKGVLPKNYDSFTDDLLRQLLRIFNNNDLDDVGGDVMGRIYEYFLSKFAKNIASDDGVFFTPKSLVKMLVNVLEPSSGIMLDPACGSGGMFVQTGDFVNLNGNANHSMTFYGQEKVEYNAQLCLMNMAVHGLNGKIVSGDEANTFYHDAHNLEGKCDYIMANPPFNVDKVKSESAWAAGRLPFGLPGVNAKTKEIGNANYLWISYFYAYLKEHKGRAGFVMASSATDSQGKDKDIREALVKTGNVDVMVSVGNNFFYTKSLPCSLWFFDKGKQHSLKDKVLFIDARNYFTVVDRTLNEWSEWQLRNLNAIVWLYRGETDKYKSLLEKYKTAVVQSVSDLMEKCVEFADLLDDETRVDFYGMMPKIGDEFDYDVIKEKIGTLHEQTKSCMKAAETKIEKRKLKAMRMAGEDFCAALNEILLTISEREWLYSKFGEGGYADVLGLCKVASRAEIEEKNYSLTPGAYVGVAQVKDDGVDFKLRMKEIHDELQTLQKESNVLMETIMSNLKEMGI